METSSKRRSLHETEKNAAYEYLYRLYEVKRWIELMIDEELPIITTFEDSLCNGVFLCKLAMKLLPDDPQWRKVYDLDQAKFKSKGLDFRHTDNLNFFINSLVKLGLPKVFYPSVSDIFDSKNHMKLVYCLHALKHFLKQQGKADSLSGTGGGVSLPKFSEDELSQANQTLRFGSTVPAFEIVDRLVEEEMQYTLIEVHEQYFTEDEECPTNTSKTNNFSNQTTNGQKHEKQKQEADDDSSDEDDLFDDPKYFQRQGELLTNDDDDICIIKENTAELLPKLEGLKCNGGGITAAIYECSSECTSDHTNEFKKTMVSIDSCINAGAPLETLRALQRPDGSLPFPYLEAEDYQQALIQEKQDGIPKNSLVVYSGLQRSLCDTLLDRMKPGAYLLRQSGTLATKEFIFSFRNEVGIKHWKLNNFNSNGKIAFGTSTCSFESLEAFIKYFINSLSDVTKLYIYPGTSFMLKINMSSISAEQLKILQEMKSVDSSLSYGQLAYVITDVNSRIRKLRAASSKEMLENEQKQPVSQDHPISINNNPITKLNIDVMNDDPWNESLMVSVSRSTAEDILDREGYPGSFLVRPSERVPGDCALAFRTRTEIRHWRIVKKSNKYYVHPRPNPYNSVADIIKHFRDAVGAETGLVMTPLVIKGTARVIAGENTLQPVVDYLTGFPAPAVNMAHFNDCDTLTPMTPPPNFPRISGYYPEQEQPSMSLNRLNPANITSWSTNDVSHWLVEQGLSQFTEIFRENCVDGECLLTLDNNLLKDDLGISQLGYRTKIMKRVQSLKYKFHPHLN